MAELSKEARGSSILKVALFYDFTVYGRVRFPFNLPGTVWLGDLQSIQSLQLLPQIQWSNFFYMKKKIIFLFLFCYTADRRPCPYGHSLESDSTTSQQV